MAQLEILSQERFAELAVKYAPFMGEVTDVTVDLITGEQGSAEGYVNQVARVRNSVSGRSVMVKQVLPQMRRIPDITGDLVLPVNRCQLEVEAFEIFNSLTPGSAPEVYGIDTEAAAFVMQDLTEMSLARFEFARLHELPDFGLEAGHFLGKNAFYTSDYYLSDHEKLTLAQKWSKPIFHDIYTKIFFDWVFNIDGRVDPSEMISGAARTYANDPFIRAEVLQLRHRYVNSSESLLHSDFHTSNIFVKPGSFVTIDGEATFWGPAGYDMGTLIGNLIDSCLSLQLRPDVSLEQKLTYEDYLIHTVRGIVTGFNEAFTAGWNEHAHKRLKDSPEFLDQRLTEIFREALGFAALIAPAMATGLGTCLEYRQLEDLTVRATAQRLTYFTARQLMEQRHQFTTVDQVCDLFKSIKSAFKISHDLLIDLYS